MRLADLRKFADIVEAGGLTQAAHRLGVTQPALSRTLRDLETRMRAQLLRRTGRGVELTPAGEEFLAFSRQTLQAFEATQRRILQRAEDLPRSMSLSIPLRLGRLLIPELHRAFAARAPETTLHVFEESSDRGAELVKEARLDAAVGYCPPRADAAEGVGLYCEALYAVGAPGMLDRPDAPIGFSALAEAPLLAPSRGSFRALVDDAFARQGLGLVVARELETADALLAFASEREGVAILPYSNFYQERARGDVVARPIVEPEILRHLVLRPGRTLGRTAWRITLAATRAAMSRVARRVRWRRLARSAGEAAVQERSARDAGSKPSGRAKSAAITAASTIASR